MRTIFLLAAISILFTSCRKDRLTASGDKTEEIRIMKSFSGVRSSGSKHIHIRYGAAFEVKLKGSDNLLPYFKTEVIGETLSVGYERVSVQDDDIEVYVTLPDIAYVSISGSGSITITGQFPLTHKFEVHVSGSGKVEVTDPFETEKILVKISGSGDADLEKISSKNAEVNISGSGDARINVEEALKVNISGSGKAYYWGAPIVDSRISGSGKVIKQ